MTFSAYNSMSTEMLEDILYNEYRKSLAFTDSELIDHIQIILNKRA